MTTENGRGERTKGMKLLSLLAAILPVDSSPIRKGVIPRPPELERTQKETRRLPVDKMLMPKGGDSPGMSGALLRGMGLTPKAFLRKHPLPVRIPKGAEQLPLRKVLIQRVIEQPLVVLALMRKAIWELRREVHPMWRAGWLLGRALIKHPATPHMRKVFLRWPVGVIRTQKEKRRRPRIQILMQKDSKPPLPRLHLILRA